MSFRLLGIAAAAAVTTLATVVPASAGCWSCGCAPAYSYVQPRVVYVQPPCAAYYPSRPVYVVNQGPTFTQAPPPEAMPSPYIHHRPRPYPYGASMPHWRHHYRHHRVRGHFYRAHRVHAPIYRPHRAHVAPHFVHVPKRIVVPHRAHPVHAPMHRDMHHGKSPKPYGQTPRRRYHP